MVSTSDKNLLKSIADIVGFLLISLGYIVYAIYKTLLPKSFHRLKSVRGEVALVTGGGGGLGRLLALRLAKLGAKVVVWDVNEKGVEETVELVKSNGGDIRGYKCDLSNRQNVYEIAKKTKQEVGDVTILINNAGVLSGYLLLDTPDELIQRTFDVNIIAHFWTVKSFLPSMIKKNQGHIVTIASLAGHVGTGKLVDYCSSKHAAVGFDEALRLELESLGVNGVKMTIICPYFIRATGMFKDVDSRFMPTLQVEDVADRTIEGLLREEVMVVIPGISRLLISIKRLFPWNVLSMFLRGIVLDAVPAVGPKWSGDSSSVKENLSNGQSVLANKNL